MASNRKKKNISCEKCGKNFVAVRSDAKHCIKCHNIRIKSWQSSEHGRKMRAMALRRTRQVAIDAYGGKCACCGTSIYEFLAIDHVNGGGRKERESLSTHQIVLKVIRLGFPSDYRVLCHNCNMAIGFHGFCPHNNLTS